MKTLVVFDSLYGNTKTIAQAIADALPGKVTLVHASEATAPKAGELGLLVVGAPTHGGRPSPAAQAFLKQIQAPTLKGTNVAGFDTRAVQKIARIFGYAAPRIARALKKKGGTPVGSPGDFYVLGTEGPLREGEIERVAAWTEGLLSNST